MEVIDKTILLLQEYKKNRKHIALCDAIHFIEKLLNLGCRPKVNKDIKNLKCEYCGIMFASKRNDTKYCEECRYLRVLSRYKEIRKAKKNEVSCDNTSS